MREADVAIRMGTPTQPDLIQRHLMTVHSHIYAAPSYLEEFGPIESADDLLTQRLIVYGEGPLSDIASPNWLLRRSGEAESRHRVVLEANNIYCILRAVESGLGISALPDYVARERPNIRQILPELQGPSSDRDFLLSQVAAMPISSMPRNCATLNVSACSAIFCSAKSPLGNTRRSGRIGLPCVLRMTEL